MNRVSFPCTFSPRNGPEGAYSLQAELTYPPGRRVPRWRATTSSSSTSSMGLVRHGLLEGTGDVVFSDVQRIEHAYVVYTVGYEAQVEMVRSWVDRAGGRAARAVRRLLLPERRRLRRCVARAGERAERSADELDEIDLGASLA